VAVSGWVQWWHCGMQMLLHYKQARGRFGMRPPSLKAARAQRSVVARGGHENLQPLQSAASASNSRRVVCLLPAVDAIRADGTLEESRGASPYPAPPIAGVPASKTIWGTSTESPADCFSSVNVLIISPPPETRHRLEQRSRPRGSQVPGRSAELVWRGPLRIQLPGAARFDRADCGRQCWQTIHQQAGRPGSRG